jgi:hypothetical protein
MVSDEKWYHLVAGIFDLLLQEVHFLMKVSDGKLTKLLVEPMI